MSDLIRILIADDHELVREGMRALLDVRPDMEVVGEAGEGEEAVRRALLLNPDVILMDLVMPKKDGITAIHEIKAEQPDTRILVITSFSEDERVYRAVKAGALGYLLKDSSPQELVRAIHDVCEGKMSLHPDVALKLIHEMNRPSDLPPTEEPLTERELEVLKLVAQGGSNKEIAAELVITERTVGAHVSNILSKLHLANRTQAALYALRTGISDLELG
jgi:NarL family two-component system response regulator LiaR